MSWREIMEMMELVRHGLLADNPLTVSLARSLDKLLYMYECEHAQIEGKP